MKENVFDREGHHQLSPAFSFLPSSCQCWVSSWRRSASALDPWHDLKMENEFMPEIDDEEIVSGHVVRLSLNCGRWGALCQATIKRRTTFGPDITISFVIESDTDGVKEKSLPRVCSFSFHSNTRDWSIRFLLFYYSGRSLRLDHVPEELTFPSFFHLYERKRLWLSRNLFLLYWLRVQAEGFIFRWAHVYNQLKKEKKTRQLSLFNNFSHNNYLSKIIIKCGKLLRE